MIKISKVLLVDMDDVIENLCPCWCRWLNEHYGTNVSAEEIVDWDINKFFPELTREQIFEPLFKEEFWKTVTPKLDAIKYLNMELTADMPAENTDFFDTTIEIEKVKMLVRRSYPYVPLFLASLDKETSPEALEAVSNYIEVYRERIREAYANVERIEFAPYVDDRIFDMTISYTMKGILEEEYAKDVFDEKSYMGKIKVFLSQMRKMSQAAPVEEP